MTREIHPLHAPRAQEPRVCPKCHSLNVERTYRADLDDIFFNCRPCGQTGFKFPRPQDLPQ